MAGLDLRGSATGTRQMDALRPQHLVGRIDAVFFSGGSAFGLDAAAGVMTYLEERGVGFLTGQTSVPIVPAAILYDLALGRSDVRPTPDMARRACDAADGPDGRAPAEGSAGAGTGASVGKLFGPRRGMKGGVGTLVAGFAQGRRRWGPGRRQRLWRRDLPGDGKNSRWRPERPRIPWSSRTWPA